jgi:hypothetical protein
MMLCALMMFASCKKDQVENYKQYYNIADNKKISTLDLAGMEATIEWIGRDGIKHKGSTFVDNIHDVDGWKGTRAIDVNGRISGVTVHNEEVNLPMVAILVDDKNNVYAFKPYFHNEGMVWNVLSNAPIGVVEDFNKIIISSNGIYSPTKDDLSISIEITIFKFKK